MGLWSTDGNGGQRGWASAVGLAVHDGHDQSGPARWPRFAATLLSGYILVTLAGTLFFWWRAGPLQLQPLIVVIVSAGFRMALIPAAVITLLLSLLSDVSGGGPVGMEVTAYMVVLCLCAVAQRKLEINSWPFQMAAVGLLSLVRQGLLVSGMLLMDMPEQTVLQNLWVMPVHAVLVALTAPLFFSAIEWLTTLFQRFSPSSRRCRK